MPFSIGNKPRINLADNGTQQQRVWAPRENFRQIRDNYRAMDDDDLSLELITLGDAIAGLKAELEANLFDDAHHKLAAERQLAFHRARAKTAHSEKWRREREHEEREAAQKQANFERQKRVEEEALIRKAERIRESNTQHNRFARAFIAQAKKQLKAAAYDRIFNAAQIEAEATEEEAHSSGNG